MFEYIIGSIRDIDNEYFVLENNNIGYKVNSSLNTVSKIELNKEYLIYIFLNVKDDSINMYGFIDKDELHFFTLLTSVSGVGPKSALSILSLFTVNLIVNAILDNDINALSKANGIGKKTAARIILDLKDKVDKIQVDTNYTINENILENNKVQNVIDALQNLGFIKNNIEKIISTIDVEDMDIEDIIKYCLVRLS